MKRGSIEISFGFIFSIIVAAAIIGVAFYAITYFLNLGKSSGVALFYQDFQEEIDSAWSSEIVKDRFVGNLPGSIKAVCLKDENSVGSGEEYDALKDYFISKGNMFMYPPENAYNQVSRKIQHVDLSEIGWHCFRNRDGKVEIPYEKGSFDALVRIKKE